MRHAGSLVLSLILVGLGPAQAQEPKDAGNGSWGQHVGPQVPSTPARMIDWERQSVLRDSHPGWQSFSRENPDWQVLFDERNDQPAWCYGPGITVAPGGATRSQIAVAAEGLKHRFAPLVGQSPESYELHSILPGGHLWYVHFIQRHEISRVLDATLTFRIDRSGRLLMWGGRFVETAGLDPLPILSAPTAQDRAIQHLRERGLIDGEAAMTGFEIEPVIHVETSPLGYRPTSTWLVKFMSSSPRADWVVFVDSRDGSLVAHWNEIRECGHDHGHAEPETFGLMPLEALAFLANVTGKVRATTHEGLLPHQTPVMTDQRDIYVTAAGQRVTTDASGDWAFNGGGATISVTSGLDGPWITSSSSSGASAAFSGSTGSGTFNVDFTDANSTIGERDMVHFTNKTHATLKARAPQQTLLDRVVRGNANLTSGSCNAFYSPQAHSINFYAASSRCINTGTSSTVVAHEYGHGVTIIIFRAAGRGVPGHFGEGFSDAISSAVEDVSTVGQGFSGIGTNVRELNNNCQYPTSCGTQIHSRGRLIGGCFWHTREAFNRVYGPASKVVVDEYLFRHFNGAPQDEIDSLMEFLLLDDNDGNLANGTPNVALLREGYTLRHGVPFPLQLVSIDHAPLGDTHDQHQGYTVRARASTITMATVASMNLLWRSSGTSFNSIPMVQLPSGEYEATIPNQVGGRVEYYIRAQDSSGVQATDPAAAPGATYAFLTAPSSKFFQDGFETPSGWVHVQVRGQDDWQNIVHGNPSQANDPPSAYEGSLTWGNDLVPASNWNGDYSANVENHLTSAAIDCRGRTGVTLAYRRWLTVEDGFYDQAQIEISNNGGSTFSTVWANPIGSGTQHFLDTSWVEHRVDISAFARQPGRRAHSVPPDVRWRPAIRRMEHRRSGPRSPERRDRPSASRARALSRSDRPGRSTSTAIPATPCSSATTSSALVASIPVSEP